MRTAHHASLSSFSPPLHLLCSLMLAASALQAQAGDAHPLDAAAPTLPLTHQPLQASGEVVQQPGDWRAANRTVAEFSRGHADIVKWEAAHAAPGHDGAQKPQQPHRQPAHQHQHQHQHRHHMPSHGHTLEHPHEPPHHPHGAQP